MKKEEQKTENRGRPKKIKCQECGDTGMVETEMGLVESCICKIGSLSF
jgi:hypothetical protein